MFKRRSIAAVAVVLLSVSCAPPAAADPAGDYATRNASRVCKTLDAHPTFDGVTGTIAAIIEDGNFTVMQAAKIIVYSVETQCDRHLPLLHRYANQGDGGREA